MAGDSSISCMKLAEHHENPMDWPRHYVVVALDLTLLCLVGPRIVSSSLLLPQGDNGARTTSADGPPHKLHACLAICPAAMSPATERHSIHAMLESLH